MSSFSHTLIENKSDSSQNHKEAHNIEDLGKAAHSMVFVHAFFTDSFLLSDVMRAADFLAAILAFASVAGYVHTV